MVPCTRATMDDWHSYLNNATIPLHRFAYRILNERARIYAWFIGGYVCDFSPLATDGTPFKPPGHVTRSPGVCVPIFETFALYTWATWIRKCSLHMCVNGWENVYPINRFIPYPQIHKTPIIKCFVFENICSKFSKGNFKGMHIS